MNFECYRFRIRISELLVRLSSSEIFKPIFNFDILEILSIKILEK